METVSGSPLFPDARVAVGRPPQTHAPAWAPAIIIFAWSGADALPLIYGAPTPTLGLIVWE